MKILYITPSLAPEWGGPTTVVTGLTEALVERGVEVSIFTTAKRGEKEKIIRPNGVDVRIFTHRFLSRFWRSYSPSINEMLKKEVEKCDIVHIHELWHYPHYAAYKAAKRTKKPYLITPHGALEPWALNYKSPKKKIYMRLIQKQMLDEASALHAITEAEIEHIHRFGLKNLITVIPNGINPEEFQILPPKEEFEEHYKELKNKKVILFLSRIHPKKGLDILARASGKIVKNRDDIRLVIIGPDSEGYKAEVIEMFESMGILNKTIFTGMLTGREKLTALSRADVFVLPSYSEGFSMAILEAMACGIPIIITNKCNFPEVKEAGTGIIIEPDAEQLTDSLEKLLDDEDISKQMGKKGKKLIMERYTWNKIAERMIKLYENILDRR